MVFKVIDCRGGIMGLLIGGWCDMFGMDSTTSYKLSNSLSLSSIGLC
jgi:hypothetical protein